MKKYTFLLSSMTLFPLPLSIIMNLAKKAGFDGVEIMMFGNWTFNRVDKVQRRAKKMGLDLHFHQVWSPEESSDDSAKWLNTIFRLIGWIPKDGYKLESMFILNSYPAVIYADRVMEWEHGHWIQTCLAGYKKPRIQYNDFIDRFLKSKYLFPIVFDTLRLLEWRMGKSGISNLAMNSSSIRALWKDSWDTLGMHHIEEIRFNDFDPGLGDSKGRKVYPGTGAAPLNDFALMVRTSGWSGTIIPEVRPFRILTLENLKQLREHMNLYFYD